MDCRACGPFSDGSLAVVVFFTLSGLVLSQPFLRTADRRQVMRMAIGRYPRLAIPVTAASFLALVMLLRGWCWNQAAAPIIAGSGWLGTFLHVQPQWQTWLRFSLFDAYLRYDGAQSYGPFLWTMEIEFLGSFLVFGILGLLGHTKLTRLLGCLMAAALFWHTLPFLIAFVVGLLIADLATPLRACLGRFADLVGLLLLGTAWVISALCRGAYTPVLVCLPALMLVLSVAISTPLQRLLQVPLSRWLGRVSFPLYLVHGLVICGPISWLLLHLHAIGLPDLWVAMVLVPTTLALSLLAAQAFLPIEQLAVRVSHETSTVVFARLPKTAAALRWVQH